MEEVKLDSINIVFKRHIEKLKFHRIAEKDWHDEYMPSSVTFLLKNEQSNGIYYTDEGKYIIVSNFKGGCSMSRKQSKPMDLDELFELMDGMYDDIVRETLTFTEPRKLYKCSDYM